MKYKRLVIRSYARSASNFIVHNTLAIDNEIPVEKSYWGDIDKQKVDQVLISVLRDPKEAIISDLSMSLGDNFLDNNSSPEIYFDSSINNFKKYLELLNNNIDKIFPFTFDQIIKDPKTNFSIFLSACGYKKDFIFPNVKINKRMVNNKNSNEKQLFLPTSKNLQIYKHIINNNDIDSIFLSLQNDYNITLSNIYKRQLDF